MGKSRCKSRKHKGGNPKPVAVDCNKGLCPTLTGAGGSLMGMANAGVKQQKTDADRQAAASKHLASGGGKKKKGGAARIICPQPAAGSGGSISAGGSPYAGCSGQSTSQQQGANAVHDGEAKNLSTEPPKSPFSPLERAATESERIVCRSLFVNEKLQCYFCQVTRIFSLKPSLF